MKKLIIPKYLIRHMALFICFLTMSVFFSNCTSKGGIQTETGSKYPIQISEEYPQYFVTNTGATWIPIATNYLPSRFRDDGDNQAAYELMEDYFKKFSENGGNSMRIWISTAPLEIEDTKEGDYNPEKFKRIDKMLELAEKYNIYIKFTLHHIRSIQPTNEGVAGWSNSTALATAFQNITEYINTPKGINSYLNRARALAARYKDHKQIYCWELWNEMDALPSSAWPVFTPAVLDSVKKIFPNRLVVQTLGSLHSKTADMSYQKLFSYKNNDFISIHRYLDSGVDWEQYEYTKLDIDELVSTAMDFAHQYVNDRPIIINEIGAVEPNHTGPYKYYGKDKDGMLIHDMIFAPFFCGAAGTGAMWHWDSYIYRNDLWYHYKRFKNAIEGVDPVKERFKQYMFESDGVRCFALGGTTKTIIWGRDSGNNWRTELEQGIAPQPKNNVIIKLEQLKNSNYKSVKIYDPWQDHWSSVKINNGQVAIPPFIRSFVILFQ